MACLVDQVMMAFKARKAFQAQLVIPAQMGLWVFLVNRANPAFQVSMGKMVNQVRKENKVFKESLVYPEPLVFQVGRVKTGSKGSKDCQVNLVMLVKRESPESQVLMVKTAHQAYPVKTVYRVQQVLKVAPVNLV